MAAPSINPARYDTKLSAPDEKRFQSWKQRFAPNDSGYDYDFRGAFKAGVVPDLDNGHWPDTFKKPNHPTFSNESQYAKGDMAKYAGKWDGENYIAPMASKTYTPEEIAANRQAMLDRVRGGTQEQVALRENEARNRYRNFLYDQGQDPDTIGTARIQRSNNGDVWANNLMSSADPANRAYYLSQLQQAQTTAPRMTIPTLDQEYDAINTGNQIAGMQNRERIAANRLAQRAPWESANILNSLQMENGILPNRSSELSRRAWLDRLSGAYDWRNRILSSNGFAR